MLIRAFLRCGLNVQRLESLLCCLGIDQMEMRVDLQSFLQLTAGLVCLSRFVSDHRSMKKEQRVTRSIARRVLTRFCSLVQFAVLVKGPRQRVPGIDVAPDFELFLRQTEGLAEF